MSIMLPPEPDDYTGPSGWLAADLHPDEIPTAVVHRFIAQFQPGPDDECWLWQGRLHPVGYGVFSDRPARLAHRLSWVLFSGQPLTRGLTIDHLCFNKRCVNPHHLEPVTLAENLRRAREHYGQSERPGPPAEKWVCPDCGTVTRNDGVRRHRRRKHGLTPFARNAA